MKFALIGPWPAPRGGVSIHLLRIADVLRRMGNEVVIIDESRGIKPGVFHLRGLNFLEYFRLIMWADVVHVHSGTPLLRFFHVFVSRLLFKNVFITFHSYRSASLLGRLLSKGAAAMADRVISVSAEINKKLGYKGIIVPAFVPPVVQEFYLDSAIDEFIAGHKDNGLKILACNASQLKFDNGVDLYGLDIIVDAFASGLSDKFACVFVVSSVGECFGYYGRMKNRIRELGLENFFLLISGDYSFPAVLKRSDLFVRATSTDGDSVSIREALSLGVVTIASSCVKRPVGVLEFESRNLEDLIEKIEYGAVHGAPGAYQKETQDYLHAYKGVA